jgi:hypothetical protein
MLQQIPKAKTLSFVANLGKKLTKGTSKIIGKSIILEEFNKMAEGKGL